MMPSYIVWGFMFELSSTPMIPTAMNAVLARDSSVPELGGRGSPSSRLVKPLLDVLAEWALYEIRSFGLI